MTSSKSSAVVRRVHLPDTQAMHEFLLRLSRASRNSRFHGAVNDVSPAFLRRLVSVDGERHAAWVACVWGPNGEEIVGEAVWYVVEPEQGIAEFAISVRDDWQGQGVADQLMSMLVRSARQVELRQLYGDVMQSNARMLAFMRRHGMVHVFCDPPPEPGVTRIGCTFDVPTVSRAAVPKDGKGWLERLSLPWS